MQIVIDIPERIRVAILNGEYCGILDDRIFNAIANGTPLEQEPCDDAISRQAVLDEAFEVDTKEYGRIEVVGVDAIDALPPANPQPKTGHWIEEIDDYGETIGWHCDKCYEDSGFTTDCKWNHCPNCGARMIEPQERSE